MALDSYAGEEKLCFCLDVGTTMSAVSFAHLKNDVEPQIRLVTRWPGQEDSSGECKVPSVVRYTKDGRLFKSGAEAVEEPDDSENTVPVKWFKLHLQPMTTRVGNQLSPHPLPDNVPLKTVYSDFLRFLFQHAQQFVHSTCIDPDARGSGSLWTRLEANFVVIMAIPNGWDDTQQSFLREAVVSANILPPDHDSERLKFVSEAEASVHFAIRQENIRNWLRKGRVLAVCDAGGSTVDTTVYQCASAMPNLRLKEVTSSECVQAGSVYVDEAARLLLERKLESSKYKAPEYIDSMVREFEKKTKRKFDGTQEKSIIQFGHNNDNDRPIVSSGRVYLSCSETQSIFEQPIAAIINSVKEIKARAKGFEAILLVGGFAESAYLRTVLRDQFQDKNVAQFSIDGATNKAAVEGGLAWFVRRIVVARAARTTYGVETHVPYDKKSTEHLERAHLTWVDGAGVTMLGGLFSPLILKNQVVENDKSIKKRYKQSYHTLPSDLEHVELELLTTDHTKPGKWSRNVDGTVGSGFRRLCALKADLSGLKDTLRKGRNGWQVEFEIEICFGQTSLSALLIWKEGRHTRRSPMMVVPHDIVWTPVV